MWSIQSNVDICNVLKFSAIACIGYFLLIFFLKYMKLRHIGGPTPIPLIGNLLEKYAITKTMKYLRKTADKYGDIFVFWGGRQPFVVVTDRIAVREVLTNPRVYKKGFVYDDYFSIVFGKGLVTCPFGERYKRDRSMLSRFFTVSHLQKFIPLMIQCTQQLIKTDCMSTFEKLESFDADWFFKRLFTHFFMKFSMNYDAENHVPYEEVKELVSLVSDGSVAVGQSAMFGLPTSTLLNPKLRRVKKEIYRLNHFIDFQYETRLKNRAVGKGNEEPDDLFKAMIDAKLPLNEIYDQMTTLISAGHDTSAYFSSYTAYLLAQNMDVQKKVKAEINEVVGDRTDITADDLSKLKYLSCVFKESLRLFSVIPCVTRATAEDTTIPTANNTKVMIPAGTDIMVPFIVMNRNGKIWDEAYNFNPDRFIDVKNLNSPKHGYFPFAYGPRHCIGNNLAMTSSMVAFVTILKDATLELLEGFTPVPLVGISLVSANGMKLRYKLDK